MDGWLALRVQWLRQTSEHTRSRNEGVSVREKDCRHVAPASGITYDHCTLAALTARHCVVVVIWIER
jgi:hypothetical protein